MFRFKDLLQRYKNAIDVTSFFIGFGMIVYLIILSLNSLQDKIGLIGAFIYLFILVIIIAKFVEASL